MIASISLPPKVKLSVKRPVAYISPCAETATGLTENNNFSFKGGYYDYYGGGFYYGDLACGAIYSLNDQLEVSGIVANMGVTGGQSIIFHYHRLMY